MPLVTVIPRVLSSSYYLPFFGEVFYIMKPTEHKYTGGMLGKGLSLLVILGEYPNGVGVSTLAREAGLPVSTVHRLLTTMASLGFVSFDADSRQYSIGLKVFELSYRVSLVRDLGEVALPVMRRIMEITKATTLMSVRDGEEIMYVERVEGPRRIRIQGAVGERLPLHCTSQGKVLLAFLPESEREKILGRLRLEQLAPNTITDLDTLRGELDRTRMKGYAVANEEAEEGICAVAVPIIGPRGRPVAALCIAAPVFQTPLEDLERFVPLLRDGARDIGVQLPRTEGALASMRKEMGG
jgi:IclR family acetate operon transcriptional repressor